MLIVTYQQAKWHNHRSLDGSKVKHKMSTVGGGPVARKIPTLAFWNGLYSLECACVCAKLLQSCPTLCNLCVSFKINLLPACHFVSEFFLLWGIKNLSFIKSWDQVWPQLKDCRFESQFELHGFTNGLGWGWGVEILSGERMGGWGTQKQHTPKPSLHNKFWSRPEWTLGTCFDFSWISEFWLLQIIRLFLGLKWPKDFYHLWYRKAKIAVPKCVSLAWRVFRLIFFKKQKALEVLLFTSSIVA